MYLKSFCFKVLWIIQICTSAFKLELCVFLTSQHPKCSLFFHQQNLNPVYVIIRCCSGLFNFFLAGLHAFTEFLKSEYSEENILFWQACVEYKKISCRTERMCEANRIYSEFVQTEAPRQVCWLLGPWGFGNVVKVPVYKQVSYPCSFESLKCADGVINISQLHHYLTSS